MDDLDDPHVIKHVLLGKSEAKNQTEWLEDGALLALKMVEGATSHRN